MTAAPETMGEQPAFRNEKACADLAFALQAYERKYGTVDQAPEFPARAWLTARQQLDEQLALPTRTAAPVPRRGELPPGVPHHGSRSIYDVRDVPAFCRSILEKQLRKRGQSFQSATFDYEDALSTLVAAVYQMAWRYDPKRTSSFRLYATFRLTQHAVPDIGRHVLGRNGARAAELSHAEVDERADSARRPWDASPEDSGDLLGSASRDRAGVEADRVGTAAWRGAVLSLRTARGAADGARARQRDLPDSF